MKRSLAVVSLFLVSPRTQMREADPSPADLKLDGGIAWQRDDGAAGEGRATAKVDRGAVLDAAIAEAGGSGKLVLWYVYRIVEKQLGGRQMYRAPILDLYTQQVLFADADVADIVRTRFVPLRMTCDEAMSERFGLRPLQFVEPAVVFLDGAGKVVHVVERLRTFDALWFAQLLRRVLASAGVGQLDGDQLTPAQWCERGDWDKALAAAQAAGADSVASQVQTAGLLRRLRRADEALALLDHPPAGKAKGADGALVRTERGLILLMQGQVAAAAPLLRDGFAVAHARQAEAGYLWALCRLRLGQESEATRLFGAVADRFPDTAWGRRAQANVQLGKDERPRGAAFANFEHIGYLPDAAYGGELPRDTTWAGPAADLDALAQRAVIFLLESQRENGGFTDSRYAYWPNTTITPNAWVAITALAATALLEFRDLAAERVDVALAAAERFMFDPARLNRGSNEDVYADAYRLLYLTRKLARSEDAARQPILERANALVRQAQTRQYDDGFWAHEYKNAFCTGAMLWSLVEAKSRGVDVPDEMMSKGAEALLAARHADGSFVYGGTAHGQPRPSGRKDAAVRMPMCEALLLAADRSDLDKVGAAFRTYFEFMDRIETVRRNDFHSDGELAGFFFFHGLYHNSQANQLLPEAERKANAARIREVLLRVPEMDGSFVDSHELGRSYGTAMALLTLANVGQPH